MRGAPAARRRAAAALLLAGLGGACGGRDAPAAWTWIEAAPEVRLVAAELRELACDRRFDFASGTLPAGVELLAGSAVAGLGEGLTLRGGTAAPRLALDLGAGLPAPSAARVIVAGVRRGSVRVSRAGGGAAPPSLMPGAGGTGRLRDQFLFEVPATEGDAGGRFELEPTTAAGEIVTLREVCFGSARVSPARLDQLASVAWKVTVGDETRDALLVPSSGRLARRGTVARGARLRFGLAVLAGGAERLQVTVEARRSGAAATIPLQERTLGAAELERGWVDLEAVLAAARGDEVELALAIAPAQATADFAVVVSAPRVEASVPAARRPNVVLVVLDTLRADRLSLYGYGRPTSPRLDAWAARHAVLFEHAIAPSGWTLPSHFSLFTGLDAHRHPANYNSVALDVSAYTFLAEELWRHGYQTQAITGGVFVHPDYALAKGFERFRAWRWRDRLSEELEANLAAAHGFLDSHPSEPFLLLFHTYETHAPNPPREPFYTRFGGRAGAGVVDFVPDGPAPERAFLATHRAVERAGPGPPTPADDALVRDTYDSAVAFLDERLAPLLARLAAPPFAGNTVVVVTSDHGEALGEAGRYGHAYLTMDNLWVPLLVAAPGHAGGQRVGSQVRLVDLFATVLELAGVEVPAGVDSRSLVPLLGGAREPGRAAWAYAASTNYGLAMVMPDGLKLEWRNTVWRPAAGELRWLDVAGAAETASAAPPEAAAAGRLTAALEAGYRAGAVGLRVRIATDAEAPVALELITDLIDPVSTKSARVASPGLSWRDVGALDATLTRERPLELQFERVPRPRAGLRLRARTGCGEAGELAVDEPLSALRAGLSRRLALPACGAAPAATLELALAWQGPVPSRQLSADDALRDDLRALGYLQ